MAASFVEEELGAIVCSFYKLEPSSEIVPTQQPIAGVSLQSLKGIRIARSAEPRTRSSALRGS